MPVTGGFARASLSGEPVSGHTTQRHNRFLPHVRVAIACVLAVFAMRGQSLGQGPGQDPGQSAGQTGISGPTDRDPISITADLSHDWTADGISVSVLRGHCQIIQAEAHLSAQKMVVWRVRQAGRDHITAYLEDGVRAETATATLSQPSLLMDLVTRTDVTFQVRRTLTSDSPNRDALYDRAESQRTASRRGSLQQTQYVVPDEGEAGPELRSVQVQSPTGSLRRIRVFPRSSGRPYAETFPSDKTTPPEQIYLFTGGINLLVEGVEEFGTVDLAADRVVIWTQKMNLDLGHVSVQTRDTPFQAYLEGNIVVRQGQNVLRATRAFYDAREDRALLLDAELKTFIPMLQGNLRVRAARIRQLSQKSFHAQQAWASTSQFGKPGYRLQASDIYLDHRQANSWMGPQPGQFLFPGLGLGPQGGIGIGAVDPATGAPIVEEVPWVTALNNTFVVEDIPVFYAPYLSSRADDPNIPLRHVEVEHDSVFGLQVQSAWNIFKLLGMDAPSGIEWDLLADYRTERGPGIGTSTNYRGTSAFGVPGPYSGKALGYYQYDGGKDNLGLDRRSLVPESKQRRRLLLRHRHDLPAEMTLLGEIGYVSDRNFLEQYYEDEFDKDKDNETLLHLKQGFDNWNWSLLARPQLNGFENTTEWYPRGDFSMLSQPLLNGLVTWSSHTSAGYGRLRPADAPSDPNDVFDPLPYYGADVGGAVLMTRHELDLPFDVGPVRLVPYVMGEAAYWSEDSQGESIDRLLGTGGIRGSVMVWRIFPYVWSRIFNLNGLAHKMVFDADYSLTDVSRPLDEIPQYNEFDENSQERFRQRFLVNTFGSGGLPPIGGLPPEFDPRFYAVRSGAGRTVTAPYHELVNDQQVLRLGWRHRLQTKAGPPERLRIKDWMTLDLEASYFPKSDRDNFGEDFGLLGARYNWLVGDRTRLLANAYYDLFDDAQQLWNVGLLSQRSTRGSVYAGLRQIKAAGLDSQILTASCSYRMSPKWISTIGTAFDIGENKNRGQSLTITRIGADFLVHFGANFDASKDNAGFAIAIEPRFGAFDTSSMRLSSLLGVTPQ